MQLAALYKDKERTMHRRGFLGLLGKLLEVGAAIGVAPALLAPFQPEAARREDLLVGWGDDGTAFYIDEKPDFKLAS